MPQITDHVDDILPRAARGRPVVATAARWAGCTLAMGAASGVLLGAYMVVTHSSRTPAGLAWVVMASWLGGGAVLWPLLRAEESRLARELRIARTGTPVLRAMVVRRRHDAPLLGRLLSTPLGAAAVLLADGDRAEAMRALGRTSWLMRGGRLERLRAVVEADIERAGGTTARFDESARRLRAIAPLGHREADLYRTHVLVKALLQRGDAVAALDAVHEIEGSGDDEARIYLVWLRAWFDLDGFDENAGQELVSGDRSAEWPAVLEGDLRVAALLARAQGAEKLVQRIETRMAAIAPPERGE